MTDFQIGLEGWGQWLNKSHQGDDVAAHTAAALPGCIDMWFQKEGYSGDRPTGEY